MTTTDENTRNLIKELNIVDIELWDKFVQWSSHYDIYIDEALDYILLGELQRACEKRGWTWNVFVMVEGGYNSVISEVSGGYDGDHWNEKHEYCIVEQQGDSPTNSLLSAYMEAIKRC